MSKNNQRVILKTVKNALKIVKLFSYDQPELSVTEISHRLNLSKNIISRMTSSLHNQSILSKNIVNGKYKLGPLVPELGLAAGKLNPVMSEAHKPLVLLQDLLNENSYIIIPNDYECVTIASSFIVAHKVSLGGTEFQSLLAGSICGLTILAGKEDWFVKEAIDFAKVRYQQIEQLQKQIYNIIGEIQKNGYAQQEEFLVKGLTTVSCPIYDPNGDVQSAIAITAPSDRMQYKHNVNIVEHVAKTAQKISINLYN